MNLPDRRIKKSFFRLLLQKLFRWTFVVGSDAPLQFDAISKDFHKPGKHNTAQTVTSILIRKILDDNIVPPVELYSISHKRSKTGKQDSTVDMASDMSVNRKM